MKRVKNAALFVGVVLCGALLLAQPAFAQTMTTGTISGTVVDQQGGVLPGATVLATHVPTGTTYETVTRGDGRFAILNVRVGGPYTIAVTMPGFKNEEQKDIMVALGEERTVAFKLQLASVSTTVTVTAEKPLIDTMQAGTAANISNALKEALPSISRSIFDIVRVNPYFAPYTTTGNGPTSISIAGRNNRYNNVQIDGSVDNDVFGLSSQGTPEGQTGSQPISLDAVQEIQLVVSPYDVRQGGFTGGGVNVITKSGTNSFAGTAFIFGRNQSWVGKYYNPNLITNVGGVNTITPGMSAGIAAFSDKQDGGSLGGPVVKNRVFFFGSADYQRQLTPTGISMSNFTGGQAAVDQVLAALQAFGYKPAANPEAQYSKRNNSDKIFGRVDMNLAKGEQFTIRHNFVHGLADIGTPSNTSFILPDRYYDVDITTHSTVAQLNSAHKNWVNEARFGWTHVLALRGAAPGEITPFPYVSITVSPGITVGAGRDNSSTANQLEQRIVEINDDFSLVAGKHTLTFGTHDEFFKFRNLFIQNTFGNYSFNSIPLFQAGLAQSYTFGYSNNSDPNWAARFSVYQWGGYVGDEWRAAKNFSVTSGIRFDGPHFSNLPTYNPVAATTFGYSTAVVPHPLMVSPRVGFNYDLSDGQAKSQIRGGVGMFTGRTPYVWLSNQYGNTGIDTGSSSCAFNTANNIVFISNPAAQTKTPTGCNAGVAVNVINVIDPNYKFPELLRGNFAYDSKLLWGMTGSAEFLWSKTLDDILYQNLNITQPAGAAGVIAIDGRPLYLPVVSTLSNVLLLTNVHAGHSWSLGYSVHRPMKQSWSFDASYLYGQAFIAAESQSSVAATSFSDQYTSGSPNNPPMSVSDFDPGHRVSGNLQYQFHISKTSLNVSLYYSGQSGHPYTINYSTDANGDKQGFNDNLLIPSAAQAASMTFTNGTYQNLLSFLPQCALNQIGQIMARNSCRAPWINSMDLRLAAVLPFKKVKAELTLDILNVLNLLNSSWGLNTYVNFNEMSIIAPVTTQPTGTTSTTTPKQLTGMNLATITSPTFTKFAIDDVRSRWQMQGGLSIRF